MPLVGIDRCAAAGVQQLASLGKSMAAAARTLAATLAYCCRAAAPSSSRRLVRTQATLPPTRDGEGVAALLKDGAKCVIM